MGGGFDLGVWVPQTTPEPEHLAMTGKPEQRRGCHRAQSGSSAGIVLMVDNWGLGGVTLGDLPNEED